MKLIFSFSGLKICFVFLLLIILIGCSSTVRIYSIPDGADAYVDGQYLGKTPVLYSDSAIVGTSHAVEIKMEGYETSTGHFSRTSGFNMAACIGGGLVWIPFSWMMNYPPMLKYKLEPKPIATHKQSQEPL